MKQALLIFLLFPSLLMAGENFSVEQDLNRDLGLEIYRFYAKEMHKAAKNFNKRKYLSPKQAKEFKTIFKYSSKNIKLPKAVYNNGVIWFNVEKRKVKIHMDSFIDRKIQINDQVISLGYCQNKKDCINSLAKSLKTHKKTVQYSIPFFSNAYASVEKFELTDYKIIAAMMALDDDLQDVGGMFTSKEESRNKRNQNFAQILKKFKPMKEKCESESWNIDDKNDPSIHRFNDMAKLLKKVAEFTDKEDQEDYVKEKLGENPSYYNEDQKKSRAVLANYFFGNDSLHWRNFLSCEGVQKLMTGEAKLGYITNLDTSDKGKGGVFNKEACEEFNQLKECLVKYNTTAKNIYQGKGKQKLDDDDKEFFAEEVYDVIEESTAK